jgi:hypothetical protein
MGVVVVVAHDSHHWQMRRAVAEMAAVFILVIRGRAGSMMDFVCAAITVVTGHGAGVHSRFQAAEDHDAHQQLQHDQSHRAI